MSRHVVAGFLGLALAGCATDRSTVSKSRAAGPAVGVSAPLPSIHESIASDHPRDDPRPGRDDRPADPPAPQIAGASPAPEPEGRPAPYAGLVRLQPRPRSGEPAPAAPNAAAPDPAPVAAASTSPNEPKPVAAAPTSPNEPKPVAAVPPAPAANPVALPPEAARPVLAAAPPASPELPAPPDPGPAAAPPVVAVPPAAPPGPDGRVKIDLAGGRAALTTGGAPGALPEPRADLGRDPLLGPDPDVMPEMVAAQVPPARAARAAASAPSPSVPAPAPAPSPAPVELPTADLAGPKPAEPASGPAEPAVAPPPVVTAPVGPAPVAARPPAARLTDPLLGPNPDVMPMVKAPVRRPASAKNPAAPKYVVAPDAGLPPQVGRMPENARRPAASPAPAPAADPGVAAAAAPTPAPSAGATAAPTPTRDPLLGPDPDVMPAITLPASPDPKAATPAPATVPEVEPAPPADSPAPAAEPRAPEPTRPPSPPAEPVELPPLSDASASAPAPTPTPGGGSGFASVPVSAPTDATPARAAAPDPSAVRSRIAPRTVFEAGKPAARVGDDVITVHELTLAVANRRRGISADRPLSRDENYMLARTVLNDLVERSIVLQEAKRELKNPKQFKMFMDIADKVWLEEEMPPLLRQNAASNIHELKQKFDDKGESIDDVRQQFRLEFLSRGFLEQKLGPKMRVDLTEMRDYYMAHLKDFDRHAQVTWREVLVEADKAGGPVAARRKADALLARLRRGEDFAAVAKAASDGPNRSAGGLWETSPGGYAVPAVNAALESLPLGQVSAVIEGPGSYHIVRVEARRQAGPASFAEVQDQLRRAIRHEKVLRESSAYLDKLRKRTIVWTVFDDPGVVPTSAERVETRPGAPRRPTPGRRAGN